MCDVASRTMVDCGWCPEKSCGWHPVNRQEKENEHETIHVNIGVAGGGVVYTGDSGGEE